MIIGITGTLGAGKGTVVDYLKKKYDFTHASARDFIVQEIEKRGLVVSRDSMTEVANSLRAEHGPSYVVEKLYEQALATGKNAIIESVRVPSEIDLLKEKGILIFAVIADPTTRYERIKLRKSVTDSISFEKFVADEKREMESTDPNKQNLAYCITHADYTFINDLGLEVLHSQVDGVMAKIQ